MGMSYSTWICVDKFSDPRIDPHGIRLLTPVVRNVTDRPAEGGGGQDLVCLSVVLSPKDKTLLIRTKETSLPKGNTFVQLLPVSLYLIVRLGSNDWEPTRSQHPATRLLHNAAGHLSVPARTLGVRVFCPRPVCTTILSVGRPSRRWNGRDHRHRRTWNKASPPFQGHQSIASGPSLLLFLIPSNFPPVCQQVR